MPRVGHAGLFRKAIALTLVMTLAVLLVQARQAGVATASHTKSWHLDSIHLTIDDEDFCVNSTGTSEPSRWTDAYTNAANAL